MNDEMKRTLEALEKDLLEDDLLEDMPRSLVDNTQPEDDFDAILARILAETDDAEPAFEDPDKPHISDDPVVYCNLSNDYGNDYADPEEEPVAQKEGKSNEDKWLIALMGVASALCLGIIGILGYWMSFLP